MANSATTQQAAAIHNSAVRMVIQATRWTRAAVTDRAKTPCGVRKSRRKVYGLRARFNRPGRCDHPDFRTARAEVRPGIP